MPYRIDRNSDLVLLKNRKSNKNRLIYDENLFDDDDDDDDEDDDYLSEIIEIRPSKGRVRTKINENEKLVRIDRCLKLIYFLLIRFSVECRESFTTMTLTMTTMNKPH